MSRKEKLDETLKKEVAKIINREVPVENFLITISFADCAPDLSQIKIGVSILPENKTGTALKKLRPKTKLIAKSLKEKNNLRRVPKIIWKPDTSPRNLFDIEEELNK